MQRASPRHECVGSCQITTYYDSRPFDWTLNQDEDWADLYDVYTGELPETNANIDHYRRLFERGLIVRRGEHISVNVPVLDGTCVYPNLLFGLDIEAYRALQWEFNERLVDLILPLYPKHIRDCIRAEYRYDCFRLLPYFYEWYVEHGYLSVPEEDRRGGLTTYMYAPVLPQN